MPKTNSPARSRIVFFGTPYFGKVVLEKLLEAEAKIVGVVTQPDRPIGREQKMTPSPVKLLASARGGSSPEANAPREHASGGKEHALPVFTPASKSELLTLNSKLSTLKPTLFVIAAYGMIIPSETLNIPKHGVLNVHPSLLPKYRGASPIQAAILRGETETGATIMLADEEMDHGPILTQQKIPLVSNETASSLTEKLARLGGKLLTETIPAYLNGKIVPQPQNRELATFTKLIQKEDGKINWEMSNELIERMVRAYTPWPGVWTTIGELADQLDQELRSPKHRDLKLKILAAHLENGTLSLDLVQVEGRKPISFTDFAKGYLA